MHRHPYLLSMRRAPGELKHLSTRRKSNQQEIPLVAASEQGRAQTCSVVSGQEAVVSGSEKENPDDRHLLADD